MNDGLLTDGEFSGGAICRWIKITTDGAAPGGSQARKRVSSLFSIFLYLVLSPISRGVRQ